MSTGSSRRQILLSRETLLGLLAVLVLVAVCIALGLWQYGRYEDRRDEAATVHTNYDAAPVALEDVLPDVGAPLDPEDVWTPVTLHGSYCTEQQCLLHVRNRQHSGQVGFWQLAPFTTDEGVTMLVVRGWVPSDSEAAAPEDSTPVPEGEQTVTVRLRPAEPVLDREPPPGQTHSVAPGQAAGLMALEGEELVAQAYGELVAEDPDSPRPAALSAPDTSLGPHLSYAFQWWIFALFFPAALVFHLRRRFQDLAADEDAEADEAALGREDPAPETRPAGTRATETEDDPDSDDPDSESKASPGRGPGSGPGRGHRPSRSGTTTDHRPRRAVRARRRGQDEEEEDALIDQQHP